MSSKIPKSSQFFELVDSFCQEQNQINYNPPNYYSALYENHFEDFFRPPPQERPRPSVPQARPWMEKEGTFLARNLIQLASHLPETIFEEEPKAEANKPPSALQSIEEHRRRMSQKHKKPFFVDQCGFCKRNGEPTAVYRSHLNKDPVTGVVTCPILYKHVCELCGATGDKAHTRSYCPLAQAVRILPVLPEPQKSLFNNHAILKDTPRNSAGRRNKNAYK